MANVTFNNTNTAVNVVASSLTNNFNVTAGNSNLCAFALIQWVGTSSTGITSVTYGGQNMAPVGAATIDLGTHSRIVAYYLSAPLTGSNSLVVTGDGTVSQISANVVSLYNVNQNTPIRPSTYVVANNTTGAVSLSISSATTDLTIGVASGQNGIALTTNQTLDSTVTSGLYPLYSDHCTTPAASITDTWTGTNTDFIVALGFSVQPQPPSASYAVDDYGLMISFGSWR